MDVAGADKAVEIFAVRSAEEAARRLAKRIRQKKKKAEEKGEEVVEEEIALASVEVMQLTRLLLFYCLADVALVAVLCALLCWLVYLFLNWLVYLLLD